MKRLLLLAFWIVALGCAPGMAQAQTNPPPAPASAVADDAAAAKVNAAAAIASGQATARAPDFLEHVVDVVLELFNVRSNGQNTTTHYVISALLLVSAFLLRRVVTGVIFHQLKKLAAKTETTLDDKLFPAMEDPVATFVMVTGIFAALRVLKLSPDTDRYISAGSTVAFSLVIFWGLLRAFNAVLDHAHEVATERQMGIAAFMPWIKKTLVAVFVVVGLLMVIQSLGYNVSTILQGLGIGGLAFALAAQDTIANLFGSIVVATDQPFKIGETVKIGASEGIVEDIGLRSTKLRTPAKNLIVIPNKTVASEAITNNSRFIQRRVEQVIGLTYDTTAEQMTVIVEDIRQLILGEAEVDPASVLVFFRDFNASSLDIWLVYLTKSPDNTKHLQLRMKINLAIMRAVAARNLAFAFPTSVMHLDGPVAKAIAGQAAPEVNQPPSRG
ncbi:MAG TPA: mechanosensitive ion channel family protein [Opitutaceae bacterium]|nr:mechanosensitive ion channel family protein [Opitutaceae bacterium]